MRLVNRNCTGCHSVNGQAWSAPTLKGLYESVRPLRGGGTVVADEAYLEESIRHPSEKVVEGYLEDMMPAVFYSDVEILAMIEYIRTLK